MTTANAPVTGRHHPNLRLPDGVTLNKVPEVIAIFWVIKVLATTTGETFADYVNDTLGFGLQKTTLVFGIATVAVLAWQFSLKRYWAPVYWLEVVLISIFGTLITDNLTDGMGFPLWGSTLIFSACLALTFLVWHRSEGTLSIHSIVTRRREAFYWATILFTFALGTAAGDMIGEMFGLGYLWSLLLFVGIIAVIAIARFGFKLNGVLSFWLAYIMTRPLGASTGDLLSQDRAGGLFSQSDPGGLGLGTTVISFVFLACIVALVAYLTVTEADVQELHRHPEWSDDPYDPIVAAEHDVQRG